MINPSLIESSMFFVPIKATHLLHKVSYHNSDTGKDINHANDVGVNDALPCLTPTSLTPNNITAAMVATVVMISPSPIGFLAAVASTIDPSSTG